MCVEEVSAHQVHFHVAECPERKQLFGYPSVLSNQMFTDIIFSVSSKHEVSGLD